MDSKMKSVAEFYTDRHIFVTGGTGFIGKVLIEKLLRCCPNITNIYLLMRPKKGQTPRQRLDEILSLKIFDKLKQDQPNFMDKLIIVNGDLMEPSLAISEEDKTMLEKNVSVVFHVAATIRFDEPLRFAFDMNVLGVRKMLNLTRQFTHLKALVHVSTAYSHCDRQNIEELVYIPHITHDNLVSAFEWMDDDMVTQITPKVIKHHPNTYTFTKGLAEYLLAKEGMDLPIAIVRPSIVGATWRDPIPGWIDSFIGPCSLFIATGKGFLRSMKGDFNACADLVPVDIVVNHLITVGWYTGIAKPDSLNVYNCTTSSKNPFRWGDLEDYVTRYFKKYPLDQAIRRPKINFRTNSFANDYWTLVSHVIPAYLSDFGLYIIGKKPRMVKIYHKLHKVVNSLQYFTSHQWIWSTQNCENINALLSAEDKKTFFLEPYGLDWSLYMESFCLGTKCYVLNEDLTGLPAARRHLKKLQVIRYIFNTLLCMFLWRVLIARSHLARNSWHLIMNMVYKFLRYMKL